MEGISKYKSRDNSFDILKGIGILSVILGHSIYTNPIHNIIYSYHMPLFFIIAGYFFTKKPLKVEIKSDYKRLIIPYIFSAIVVFLRFGVKSIFSPESINLKYDTISLVFNIENMEIKGYLINASGMLWFLFALFWLKILFSIIGQYHSYTFKFILVFIPIIIILSYSSVLIYNNGLRLPYSILNALGASIYFITGILFKIAGLDKLIKNRYLIIIAIILWFLSILYSSTDIAFLKYKNYSLAIIGSISAFLVIYTFVKHLIRLTKTENPIIKSLQSLGKYSMVIYIANYFEHWILNVSRITSDVLLTTAFHFILTFIIAYILIKIKNIGRILGCKYH